MTPEEGSARTAGERHQERIVGSPRSPLASLRPLVAAGGVAAQDGRRLGAGPHLALQLPGVATTVNSSSVPEGGRTNFSPSLLFRGSWVAIPREGLADVWGSVCRIVLQTSSPTHSQIYTGRRPLPFVPYPHSPPRPSDSLRHILRGGGSHSPCPLPPQSPLQLRAAHPTKPDG